jgi:hypothetical protein
MEAKSSFDGLYESAVTEAICSPVVLKLSGFRSATIKQGLGSHARAERSVPRIQPFALPRYRKAQKRPARGQHDLCDEFACRDAQIEAVEPAYLQ